MLQTHRNYHTNCKILQIIYFSFFLWHQTLRKYGTFKTALKNVIVFMYCNNSHIVLILLNYRRGIIPYRFWNYTFTTYYYQSTNLHIIGIDYLLLLPTH